MRPSFLVSLACVVCSAACAVDTEPLQSSPLAGQQCGAGQYMVGFGADGRIVCRDSIDGLRGGAVSGNSSFDRVGIGTATPLAKLHVDDGVSGVTALGAPAVLQVHNEGPGTSFRINDQSGDASPFIVDNEGRVGVGTDSPTASLHVLQGYVRFQGAGTQVSLERNSDSPAAHYLFFGKTRGSPVAPTPALEGDLLGTLAWLGWDGTDFQNGAYIQAFIDGAPSPGKFPASLKFVTTPAAAGVGAERMRITQAGYVGIGTSAPSYKLTVAEGDICITAPGNGLILKSPDGTKCRRIGIDNAGAITLTGIGICD